MTKKFGFLGLNQNSFNQDNILTAKLNQVKMLFAGVLKKNSLADSNDTNIEVTPLAGTTAKGNSWSVSSPYELMMPRINSSATNYINKNLIQVQHDGIIRVDVTDPNSTYSLTSEPNSSEIKLVGTDEGKKHKASEIQSVFSALSNLSFTDVRKDSGELEFGYKYTCRLENDLKYNLDIAKTAGKYYLKVGAKFVGSKEIYKASKKESKQELKQKEAKLLAIEKAEKFNNKHSGWIYEISGNKAKNLTKSLNDLLEDKEQKDSDQNEESNNSTVQKG